ncbi:MAG TPA: hypothetical protein VGP46_00550, partial [Acidimicrobiales bacterium]|nr:hypothetical protein [Acidimicrobiales bacterium]
MARLEDTLATRLNDAASRAAVRPELEHMIEARLNEPERRQPRGALAVMAVTVLLVATVALVARSSSERRPSTVSPPTSPVAHDRHLAPGWSPLPLAPIQPRSQYAAVWTGEEMIVWGGYNGNTTYGDGASYAPTTRKWLKIAAGPLSPRDGPVSVWTGKAMILFGGDSAAGALSDGAAYYPASNKWRKLAPIPSVLGGNLSAGGSYAVWTGKVMLVCGFFGHGAGAHGSGSLDAATYDPATNTWAASTAAPEEAPLFGDAFWTGKEMLTFGPSPDDNLVEGLAFNPSTSKWSVLPDPPLAGGQRDSMMAVWTGSEMVVGGGALVGGLADDAAAYIPATGKWQHLPNAPVGFTGNNDFADVWTGKSAITVEDDIAGGKPLILDLATKRWSFGPKAPVPGRQEAEELWTGRTVLVWGGGDASGVYCCQAIRQGYAFT